MKVLSLVPNPNNSFYKEQIKHLKNRVEIDTITVPGEHRELGDRTTYRSTTDYLNFYPKVIKNVSKDYDIIHANFGHTAPFALAQPYRPVVLTLWGSDLMGRFGKVSKISSLFCDETVVMTEEMKNQCYTNPHVIPHGVDLELFKPMPQNKAQKLVGWDSDRRHILFPYSPSRNVKNYDLAETIVDKINNLAEYSVKIHPIYGESHEKIPQYMNASDLLLLTSHREGSPNSVKEALACNLPVLSKPVGDVPDILGTTEVSSICQDENEFVAKGRKILEMPNNVSERNHVKSYNWENISDEIVSVYYDALNGKE